MTLQTAEWENDASLWHMERTQYELRNALKRVSNAMGMPLAGEMQLILTSKTFRFGSEAADTWWLLSLLFLYFLRLCSPSFLQHFLVLHLAEVSTSIIFLGLSYTGK